LYVQKKQFLLAGGGLILLILMYFFGNTTVPKKPLEETAGKVPSFDIQAFIATAMKQLSPDEQQETASLQAMVTRGDVLTQRKMAYGQLATFWQARNVFEPYAYYFSEAAKLENSEKSLTFAGHLFLDTLRWEANPSRRQWYAMQGKELFEKVLLLNPKNDSAKVALGSCYIFGNISDNPMEGILKIREVADRDSNNVYAQLMLGMGGVVSGQFDKAIERLLVVLRKDPHHLEAMLTLAGAYERTNNKVAAIQWYNESKKHVNIPQTRAEIDARIKMLQQ
jgi:tetratricopeptide (TPR) repeat protein